jgi:NifU-like protein involved in Fe-S cluster formation
MKSGRRAARLRKAMPATLYTREILRLAASIPHHRRLESPQASAEKHSPVCGSRVLVDLALDRKGRIAALGLEVKACALGQASAALMGRHVLGRTGADLEAAREAFAAYLSGARDDPGDWPGLDLFAEARSFPARHPAMLLVFEAGAAAAKQAALAAPPLMSGV